MTLARLHLKIFGRVQDVGFRYSMERLAKQNRLGGWVKNVPEGAVECVVEGDKEILEKILVWAKKGPFWARVDKVEKEWQEFQNEFDDFEIRF